MNKIDLKTLWRTRPLFRLVVVLECVFLLLLTGLAVWFFQEPTALPFNSEIWDYAVGPARYSMTKDLLSSGRLIGRNVEQLEKLLGKRMVERKVEDGKVTQLSYVMSRGLQETYLDLDFNDGLCVGAQIRRPAASTAH